MPPLSRDKGTTTQQQDSGETAADDQRDTHTSALKQRQQEHTNTHSHAHAQKGAFFWLASRKAVKAQPEPHLCSHSLASVKINLFKIETETKKSEGVCIPAEKHRYCTLKQSYRGTPQSPTNDDSQTWKLRKTGCKIQRKKTKKGEICEEQ